MKKALEKWLFIAELLLILQSERTNASNRRQMFCVYLF